MTNSHEVLAITTAKTLAAIPAGVRSAFIQAVGGDAYYWLDSTAPADDASSGHLLPEGDSMLLTQGEDIRGFKAIQKSGDTTLLMVSYQAP